MSFLASYKRGLDAIAGTVIGYAEPEPDDTQVDAPLIHEEVTPEPEPVAVAESVPEVHKPIRPLRDDDGPRVARGDSLLDDIDDAQILKSELSDVTDAQWTAFTRAMIVQKPGDVSDSNAVGMFCMTPRRLADLGIVKKLARSKSPKDKTVWMAVFVSPLTCQKFLKSPKIQYAIFAQSMRNYAGCIASGKIEKDSAMGLSGALAILHKCGPQGLTSWARGDKFDSTMNLYDKTSGLF